MAPGLRQRLSPDPNTGAACKPDVASTASAPIAGRTAAKAGDLGFSVSGTEIALRVTETGGEGGAFIGFVMTRDERGNTDQGCGAVVRNTRVAPGATWDIQSLGYCAPSGPSNDSKSVTVVVRFTGDDRVQGELSRTISR